MGDMLSRQWGVASGAGAVFRSGADQRMNGTMVDMLLLGIANETGKRLCAPSQRCGEPWVA